MSLCVLGGTDHCWDRQGAMGSNNPDGTVVETEIEKCRHCPAIRERKVVSRITYQMLEDTGWRQTV